MKREDLILSVRELRTHFYTPEGAVKAVDDVSFDLNRGETLGIVGESGCGKSVSAYSILRLIPDPPGKIVSGKILFKGEDLLGKSKSEMRKIRGNRISIIFQEPMTSLNPVFTIGKQIMEVFVLHRDMARKEAWRQAIEMLKVVRIPRPDLRVREYPHQLSGGMRQRAMIAMALACHPEILIADEPTTALDVTIQAQFLDLLTDIMNKFGVALLYITHDLFVIGQICNEVAVMYASNIVEHTSTTELFQKPLHPYTRGLMKSIPNRQEKKKFLDPIKGMVCSLLDPPPGCKFHPRCNEVLEICSQEEPLLKEIAPEHWVSCHLFSEKSPAV